MFRSLIRQARLNNNNNNNKKAEVLQDKSRVHSDANKINFQSMIFQYIKTQAEVEEEEKEEEEKETTTKNNNNNTRQKNKAKKQQPKNRTRTSDGTPKRTPRTIKKEPSVPSFFLSFFPLSFVALNFFFFLASTAIRMFSPLR